MKKVFQYVILTICMIVSFVLIITASACIPKAFVWDECKVAYEKINYEGLYPSIFDSNLGFYDNWTNSYYIGIIANQDNKHPLKSAVANYHSNWDLKDNESVIDGLGKTFNNKNPTISSYSNYWLGIIFIYKLLLVFFSWTQIRYLFYIIVSVLIFMVSQEMLLKLGKAAAWSFILMTSIMCYGYITTCFAAVTDVITTLACCLFILKNDGYIRDKFLFCYVLGVFNFFIAYLYAPIMPIAMTLVLISIFSIKNGVLRKVIAKENAFCSVLWALGYGISAGAKQLLSLFVIGSQSGTKKLAGWIDGGLKLRLRGLVSPYFRFIYKPIFAIITIFILVVVILFVTKKIKIDIKKESLKNVLSVILPSFILPEIWFLFLAKASGHGYYVQNLGPLVFTLFFAAFTLLQKREINE